MRNNVKKLRIDYNLTQEKLANDLNVSRQTIAMIEKGEYNPTLELAFRIANYFKYNVDDIFENIHSKNNLFEIIKLGRSMKKD